MISKKTLKKYRFETIENYFNYICDSYVNGQYSQVRELFNRLNQQQKNKFFAYLHYVNFNQKFYEVLK